MTHVHGAGRGSSIDLTPKLWEELLKKGDEIYPTGWYVSAIHDFPHLGPSAINFIISERSDEFTYTQLTLAGDVWNVTDQETN